MPPLKRRALYLLLVGSMGLGGCDFWRDYSEAEHIKRATQFRDSGDTAAAALELRAALQKNPQNAQAHAFLGEVYASQELGKDAEEELRRAIALGANAESLKGPLGEALLQQQKFAAVLSEIRPGPDATKRTLATIADTRARALLGLGRRDEGCKLFDDAIAADESYASGYWGKAFCKIMERQLDAARAQLDIAAKADPRSVRTWVIIGELERSRNRPADSESAYDKALALEKHNVSAHLGRAATRLQRGKREAANEDIDAVLAMSKNHPLAHHLRGVSLFYDKKLADAKSEFETTLAAVPDYLPSVLWLGLTNVAQQQYEQAAVRLGTYLKANPGEPRIRALYAVVQARLGGAKEAKQALEQLKGVVIDDPQSLAMLAQANILVGDYDTGARYLGKAVEVSPDSAQTRVAFASALLGSGDPQGAIRELEKAIQLDPNVSGADELMILALMRLKQYDKALQAVERFETRQPKDPLPLNYRGGVLLAKGDIEAAKQAYLRALKMQPGYPLAARNLGAIAIVQKDLDLARSYYKQVLEHDKGNLEALMDLYRLEMGAKREREASSWLSEAVKQHPDAMEPVALAADRYLKTGEPLKALDVTQALAAAKPDDPTLLEMRGAAHLAAGDTASALASYERLVKVVPQSALARYRLGTAQLAAGDTREAAQSFAKASELDPAMLQARLARAAIDLRSGRAAEAMQVAKQIQKEVPASPEGPALEGDVLIAQNKFLLAAAAYERAYALDNTLPLAAKIYSAYVKAQKPEPGIALLEARLERDQYDSRTRLLLANGLLEAGRYPAAIAQYEVLLKQVPDNVLVLNNLANAAQRANDPRSVDYAERAYRLKPDNSGVQDTLGWILLQRGATPRAVELLEKAHRAEPENAETHYHYAAALAAAGEKEQARRELTALLATGKSFPAQSDATALLGKL